MPYFGVPIRNGLPIGLGTLTALAKAVAVVVPPVSSDPYFEYVSLLANTTSTNGAQNNTFLDSSTNNFSITRNGGNPGMTQGNFSPFSQTGWSNYFDGNGDELNAGSNAAFSFGTGAYTVEAWVYLTAAVSATHQPCFVFNDTTSGFGFWNENAGSQLQIGVRGGGVVLASTTTLTANTWNHIVAVRSGTGANQTAIFVNGTRVANGTDATNWTITGPLKVGGITTANYYLTGYASNVRVVKGTAVYDPTLTTLTVPTAPLPLILDTSLLTCQNNRFIDNSGYQFPITRNGDVSVQAFSPFNPTAAWSASTNGGSGYFDGTGDYLDAPNNSAFDLAAGNFTLEAWVNTTRTADSWVFGYYVNNPLASTSVAYYAVISGGSWLFSLASSGTETAFSIGSTAAVSNNAWHHIVLVRSGNTVSAYLDGARTSTATYTSTLNNPAGAVFRVGGNTGTYEDPYAGYVSSLRIVKGTAVYDPTLTTLTVPTAPLTAITNTSLLLNFTNAGIYDSASGNDLETVGNAQVSTVQAKWGTTSMYFDGTGDWLTVPDSPTQRFGTGDFTVEFWMYVTGGLPPAGIIGKGTSTTGWEISWQTGRTLRFTFGSTSTTSVATFNNNTWYHVALVRSGSAVGNVKLYLDGTAILTSGTAVTDNLNQTNIMYVGANRTGANAFTGYIDDLRITNGYARYTANFTPPTAAFPLQ